jgi:carbon monoxide dehydrogenase subunit G
VEIKQSFVVAQPVPTVWAFFHDLPGVAACLPGAEYQGALGDGRHSGKVSAKVGPFQASFEGEAIVKYDNDAMTVDFEGKGVDRRGASRGKMSMNCSIAPEGSATRVEVVADLQLAGTIAQFGRTGLITEIASQLVGEFVRNAEAELARRGPPAGASIQVASQRVNKVAPKAKLNPLSLLLSALKSWLASLFRKNAA